VAAALGRSGAAGCAEEAADLIPRGASQPRALAAPSVALAPAWSMVHEVEGGARG